MIWAMIDFTISRDLSRNHDVCEVLIYRRLMMFTCSKGVGLVLFTQMNGMVLVLHILFGLAC